jgi:hypothetical protein
MQRAVSTLLCVLTTCVLTLYILFTSLCYIVLHNNNNSTLTISFAPTASVTPVVWSELDLLQIASGWSKLTSTTDTSGADARTVKYNELLQLHKDWPERLTVLQRAYAQFVSHDAATAASAAAGEVTATS